MQPTSECTGTPAGHVLAGPTAIGKTEVAHHCARLRRGAVLSADAMLVYCGMDIGTAKPSATLRGEVAYGGIDLVAAGTPFSVADYLREARAFAAVRPPGNPLIVTGGTGLYLRCLLEGLADVPPADPALRAHWEARVAREGVAPLAEALQRQAPQAYEALNASDRANPRRLLRALERGDVPASQGRTDRGCVVALRPTSPQWHRAHIARRAGRMFDAGLLEETRDLRDAGGLSPTAAQAIGYAEALAVLGGECTREEAESRIVTRTWRLARKQMTWLRHQARVVWVDVEEDTPVATVGDRVLEAWDAMGAQPLEGLAVD